MVTAAANRIWGGCLCKDMGGVYVRKGGVSASLPKNKKPFFGASSLIGWPTEGFGRLRGEPF